MPPQRIEFIIAQTALMVGIILILVLIGAMQLTYWVAISFIGFLGLIYHYRMHKLPKKPRTRLYILVALGGVVFLIAVGYELATAL